MKKTRYSESQIIKALEEVEARYNVKGMCCGRRIVETVDHSRKSKYGDIERPDMKRVKELEDENRRLKL